MVHNGLAIYASIGFFYGKFIGCLCVNDVDFTYSLNSPGARITRETYIKIQAFLAWLLIDC